MKNLLFTLFLLSIIYSCTNSNNKDNPINNTLKINEPEFIRTIFPHSINDAVSGHIVSQVFEGLVKFDAKTLEIIPAIAYRWDVDNTNTIYTFHLRDDVFFHNNNCFVDAKGRKVIASDIKYTFKLLCTKNDDNKNFYGTLDKVLGAKSFFEKSNTDSALADIEGLKVIDDSTFQITLEKPMPFFISLLAAPAASIIPKEGFELYKNKNTVGTGPFSINKISKDASEPLILVKNPNYYKKDKAGKNLPYIDSLKIYFEGATQNEILMLEQNKIDLVMGLPIDYINKFFEKNKKDFSSNPPKYVIEMADEATNLFNIRKSNVINFYYNNMNYLDFSLVKIEEPIIANNKNEKEN